MSIAAVLANGLAALNLAPSTKSKELAESLIRESEAERIDRRRVVAADVKRAEAADLADARAHDKAIEPLKARVGEREAQLDAARLELARAVAVRRAAAMAAGQRIDRLRGELRETASPAIAAFVAEMRTLLRETYEARHVLDRIGIDGRRHTVFSNQESIDARAAAIQAAINAGGESGSLLYLPLTDAELAAALDTMRAEIPELDQPTENELRQAGALA